MRRRTIHVSVICAAFDSNQMKSKCVIFRRHMFHGATVPIIWQFYVCIIRINSFNLPTTTTRNLWIAIYHCHLLKYFGKTYKTKLHWTQLIYKLLFCCFVVFFCLVCGSRTRTHKHNINYPICGIEKELKWKNEKFSYCPAPLQFFYCAISFQFWFFFGGTGPSSA